MATDVVIRFRAEGNADNEIKNLRGTLAELNKSIVANKNALVGATAEERKNINALQMANRAQSAVIRSEIEQARLRMQAIRQIQQETRARERASAAQVRAAERTRAAQQQAVTELTAGARIVTQQLARLTGGLIQSAANMETFRNSVLAVTRDAAETDRILGQLLDLTVELVGIDTGDLISFAGRLMATGLSAEQAITAIRGVTERVAEQGKSAAVTARVLEQLTQAINSNTITAQDFRPILRELPTLFQDASNALGVNIRSLEDFRNAAEAVGGPVEAIIRLTEEMGRASEGANLDTFNAQIDILRDQAGLLAAELGEHLIPAIVSILKQVNVWIEEFRNMDDEAQSAIAWSIALATGVAALGAAVGTATVAIGAFSASIGALTGTAGLGGVATLAGQAAGGLGRVVSILGRLGSVGNLAATAGITLAQAWNQIYNDFQRTPPFEDAVESIQALDLAASQTARSLGVTSETFSGVAAESVTDAQNLISRLDELRGSFVRLANSSGDNAKEFAAARAEYRQLLPQLEALLANLPQVSTETDAVTESVEEQIEALVAHALQVIETRQNLENLAEGQEILNVLWMVASGQLEDYSASIETVIPSVINLTGAQDALNASVQAGIDATNEAIGDPLSDYIDGLDLTSESADRAFGEINKVGEAVRDADFTRAAAELTDFDDAFQLSEATIPKVTSAMREFTGTAPDIARVERAVESTTQSVDDLFDSIDALPNVAEDATTDISGGFDRLGSNIIDFVDDLASGGEVETAFENLGSSVADAWVNEFEDVLNERLSDALTDAVTNAAADEGLLTAAGSLGSTIGGVSAIALAAAVTAIPIIDLVNRAINPPEPSTDEEIDQFNRNQFFQPGDPRRDPNFDPNAPPPVRTATRDGTRRIGTGEAGQGAVASVSEGRQRRGTAPEDHANVAPPGHRYNATLGVYEPIPVIFDQDASGGSGLGAPIVATQAQIDAAEAIAEAVAAAAAEAAEAAAEALQMRIAAEMRYSDTVQDIYNDVTAAYEAAEQRKTEITQRAVEMRAEADMRLADTQQDIFNDVAAAHETSEARKTDISERATEQRTDAEQIYVDTVQGIYNSVAEAFADAEMRKTEIAQRATEQRADADESLAETQQGIYNSVADAYEISEQRKVDISERATEQRGDADERLADTQQGIYNSVADAYQTSQARIADIAERAVDNRGDAELRYSDSVQDIHNNLFLTVTGIQERLTDEVNDLRDDALDAEMDRADALVDLEQDTQDRLQDIRLDANRSRADIERDFQDEFQEITAQRTEAELELTRQVSSGALSSDEANQRIEELRRESASELTALGRERLRDLRDVGIREGRRTADTQDRFTISQQQIEAQARANAEAIAAALVTAQATAAEATTAAETAAGTTFAEAQAAFVPAADAMTTALNTLNTTLMGIDTAETEGLAGVQATLDNFVEMAGVPLTDALNNAVEPMDRWTAALTTHATAIEGIDTGETAALGGVDDRFAEVLETAGVPLTDALNNAVEPMDRWTSALTTHAEAITAINTGETAALGGVDDRFAEVLQTAGVPLTDALNNAQEPMTLFATATDRLSTSLDTINANELGLLDTEDANFLKFLDVAGVTLPDAIANAVEPLDRWSESLLTHAAAITGINEGETAALGGVDDRFAEVLQTAGVPLAVALNQSQPPMSRLAIALETYNATPGVLGTTATDTPLLEQQAGLSPQTIAQQTATAATESATSGTQAATAGIESETATTEATTATANATNAATLGTVATDIMDSDIPGAIDLARESAVASLDISSAIERLPGILEDSFGRIFNELQDTVVDILRIESNINQGASQFILDSLLESGDRATGVLGEVTAHALESLGINAEQFAPPDPRTQMELAAPDITEPIPVEIINAPAAATDMMLLESSAPTSLLQPAPPMTELTASTISVSGSVVNVTGSIGGGAMPVTVTNADEIQPIIENKVEIK